MEKKYARLSTSELNKAYMDIRGVVDAYEECDIISMREMVANLSALKSRYSQRVARESRAAVRQMVYILRNNPTESFSAAELSTMLGHKLSRQQVASVIYYLRRGSKEQTPMVFGESAYVYLQGTTIYAKETMSKVLITPLDKNNQPIVDAAYEKEVKAGYRYSVTPFPLL